MKTIALIVSLVVIVGASSFGQSHKLTINVTNIKNMDGKKIQIGIFKKDGNFPNGSAYKGVFALGKSSASKVEVEIPYGEYAIAVYQDINSNGKLDKSFVGAPKEPFGFSQNFKPFMSAPDFEDCRFVFSEKASSTTIKLID